MGVYLHRLKSLYRDSRIFKAASWYVIGNFAQKALDFAATPIFLALLDPEQYATVSIFLTWMAAFSIVITLQAQASVGRARYDFGDATFERYVSSVFALGCVTTMICLGGLSLVPPEVIRQVFRIDKTLVLLAMLTAFGYSCTEVTWQAWRFTHRYGIYTISSMLVTILRLVASIAAILLVREMGASPDADLARVVGIAVVTVMFGITYLVRGIRAGKMLYNGAYWRYAIAFSVPVIPHLLSSLVLSQSDRILIEGFSGRAAAGIYSFAYQVGSVIYLLWTNLNTVWTPWFYEQMQKENYTIIRLRARQYLLGFTLVTAGAIVVGPVAFRLVTPIAYHEGLRLVPLVMAGSFFFLPFSFYVNTEYYEKKTAYISIGTILASVVNVLINVSLIPVWGYAVAAWSTLIGYLLLFLFHAVIVSWKLRKGQLFSFRLLFGTGIAIALLATAVMLLG